MNQIRITRNDIDQINKFVAKKKFIEGNFNSFDISAIKIPLEKRNN